MSELKIEIIYEDAAVLVLNKPSGLMVHGDGRSDEPTLADWLLTKFPALKEVGEPWHDQKGNSIFRPGIVHRLDRETSGVMVVAKNQSTFLTLKNAFKKRDIHKEYRAIVYGGFKEEKREGVIDKPIGRSPADFRRYSAQPGARGTLRDAVTAYRVLAQTGESQEAFAYVAVFPKTGRTHQIRVHFKAVHHPIVCDSLYAPKKQCAFGLSRVALHAYRLELPGHLGGGVFTAPLPEDMHRALLQLHEDV